jgi:hypothetical protein
VTLMASYNRQTGGTHAHDSPSPPVAESREISAQLASLVKELNEITDRLEHLAGVGEKGEQDDAAEDP